MPAPDAPTLYNLEDQIEGAAKSVLVAALTAANITCAVVTTREKAVKATPRIELSCSMGSPLSQRTTTGQANPKQVPNAFEFVLAALICTTRPIEDDNADKHGTLRGLTRFQFSAGAKSFSGSNLPYLQILDFLPSQGTPRTQDGKSQDLSLLNFDGKVAIQNSAWPAIS